MEQQVGVDEFLALLLKLAAPLAPLDLPLLDAHGATLAQDIYAGDRLVLRGGSRIGSTQIGLAASIGLNHLPTLPHPRVVVISAGDDLVEPGRRLSDLDEEYESNSWMLTTSVREAGATAFRVHTIAENHQQLKEIIEDQLVRADLLVISGESHDESFELISGVLSELGDIHSVRPKMTESGLHNFGLVGPDRTPVITLPGDPIVAAIASEIFVRPMIRTMLGATNIYRSEMKAKLTKAVVSPIGEQSFIRATLSSQTSVAVTAIEDQNDLLSFSDAQGFILVPEDISGYKAGAIVDVMLLERSSN
jgi:molybdopterin biosynthesis enzyme